MPKLAAGSIDYCLGSRRLRWDRASRRHRMVAGTGTIHPPSEPEAYAMRIKSNKLRRRAGSWAVILIPCVWSVGCQTRGLTEDQQFSMLFDGFQLVLVDDLPAKTPIHELDASALRNTYPSDRTLIPGRVHVFRKTTNTSDDTLGMKVLPERLAKVGARVTKAPQSSKDFVYPYIGGPLFTIEFEKDGHHGTMYNVVHTSSKQSEQWEEFTVAYQ